MITPMIKAINNRDKGRYVDLSDEIDYISSGKRQISSYHKYHTQDGSQQGHMLVTCFLLLLWFCHLISFVRAEVAVFHKVAD